MAYVGRAVVNLESLSPLSHSRHHETPQLEGEDAAKWEARTWRNRLHTQDGRVVIPANALKASFDGGCYFLSKKIAGRGNKRWTSVLQSGIMCTEPMVLHEPGSQRELLAEDAVGEWLFLDAQPGKRTGGRVKRCYPRIDAWCGTAMFEVINPEITEEIFVEHLEAAGLYIGMGRWRPERRGIYGRYKVVDVEWPG